MLLQLRKIQQTSQNSSHLVFRYSLLFQLVSCSVFFSPNISLLGSTKSSPLLFKFTLTWFFVITLVAFSISRCRFGFLFVRIYFDFFNFSFVCYRIVLVTSFFSPSPYPPLLFSPPVSHSLCPSLCLLSLSPTLSLSLSPSLSLSI